MDGNNQIIRYNEDMHNSAYIKTWVGTPLPQKSDSYESAGQPRGGGWGNVRNITFSNFNLEGADSGPSITQDNGNDGNHSGTSKMEISKVLFEGFRGYLNGKSVVASINCSKVKPCKGIEFRDVKLRGSKDGGGFGEAKCKNVPKGELKGLDGNGC
jgi:galacturan 1,4-alpha-galacturonidase